MAYKQSPFNVIKGQMTNKAAGLAHGDSMAMQTDPKDGVILTGKKKTSQKKKDLLELVNAQGQYDRNRSNKVLPELAEIDSLTMVAEKKGYEAQKMYGPKFQAEKAPRLPYSVTKEKRKELLKQAHKVMGPRPSLNN
jgi:hypothetical protein